MKNNDVELKIFLMGNTLYSQEWHSLLGDKYRSALPFKWSFTSDIKNAQVIAWNGLMNKKSAPVLKEVIELIHQDDRILILENEAHTLFTKTSEVSSIDLKELRFVALPSGGVLPEDLLMALDDCYKKITHV